MKDQSSNNRNASDDDGKEGAVTSQAMGSHIADHLHHVMTVSLQIMSTMQGSYDGYEGDIQSQSSGPSTALSDPDDEAIRKRLEDLPESVQGSMNWSGWSEISSESGSDGDASLDDLIGHRDGSPELPEQHSGSSKFKLQYRSLLGAHTYLELNQLFDDFSLEQKQPWTEPEIQRISLLLQRVNWSWIELPRIFVILGTIDCLDSFVSLIDLDVSDYWFPFDESSVPSCIPRSKRSQFVAAQDLVKPNPMDLEHGQHCFFQKGEVVPLEERGVIGRGSTSVITRVLSFKNGQQYALKVEKRGRIWRDRGQWEDHGKRLIDQIRVMKGIRHRHVVEYVGSYSDLGSIGMIMSPVAEMDLKAYLANAEETRHGELRTFFGCLARGLQFLHEKGILHKDIQPRNILVHGGNVLYTDIGQASCQYDIEGTLLARMSLRYGAPELANHKPAKTSSDIWSLGIVFLEMAAVIKDVTVDYIYDFLRKHGTKQPHPRGNIISIDILITKLKNTGISTDNVALQWVKRMVMLEQELRPTASSLVESLKSMDMNKEFCETCCYPDFRMGGPSSGLLFDKKETPCFPPHSTTLNFT
jgi:tRNA A-37 threonylcarbamoyl transferase component Bud32